MDKILCPCSNLWTAFFQICHYTTHAWADEPSTIINHNEKECTKFGSTMQSYRGQKSWPSATVKVSIPRQQNQQHGYQTDLVLLPVYVSILKLYAHSISNVELLKPMITMYIQSKEENRNCSHLLISRIKF